MDEEITVWVKEIRQDNKKAFENLFVHFYDSLCKFAWRYTRSQHISEELVQDVFLKVWKSRATLDPERDIKSYLYQSVRNKALNLLKHKNLAEEYNSKIEWLNPSPSIQEHDYEEESEFVQAAQKAIEALPEGARQVYKLSRKDGLTYREIAYVLDISPKTVESQMSRALQLLRDNLSRYL